MIREGLGVVLGLLVRLWLATLRVRLSVAPSLREHPEPWVLAFFHGQQFPLFGWARRRATSVLVSLSPDGSLLAGVLRVQGFAIVRGSSSRGGARAVARLVRRARTGHDLAFAVDGPKGPPEQVKDGAAFVARKVGGVLVPMGTAIARGKTFDRAWDRFVVAWPFSRVAIVLGPPLPPMTAPEALADAIREAANDARKLLK